jgi:hypothetical protein
MQNYAQLFQLPIEDKYEDETVEKAAKAYHSLVPMLAAWHGNPTHGEENFQGSEAVLWRALLGMYVRRELDQGRLAVPLDVNPIVERLRMALRQELEALASQRRI